MSNQLFYTVTSLLKVFFEREEAHLAKREIDMITKNARAGGSTDGFRYMGAVHTQLTGPGRSRGKFDRLMAELHSEMGEIIAERKILEMDKDRIKQALAIVLKDCRSFQDIRDALPNGLKEFIPECAKLPRTRKEAYTLEDNPRSYNQYNRLREKIEFYLATRLLY